MYIQSSAVITRSNSVKGCIKNCRNGGRISIRCWIHKIHPIPRPNERAMEWFDKIDHVIAAPHFIVLLTNLPSRHASFPTKVSQEFPRCVTSHEFGMWQITPGIIKQGKHNDRLFTHSLNSTAVTFVDLLIVVHFNHSIFKMPRQRSSSWQMKKLSNQCVTIWIAELWITNDKTTGEIGVWYFFCRRRMKRHPTRGTSLGTGIMLHRQYMRIMQKYRVQRIRLRLYFRGNIRSQKWNKYDFLLNDVGN